VNVTVERLQGHRLEVSNGSSSTIVDRDATAGGERTFKSVELLLAGLGSCMAGTMLTFADEAGIAVESVRVDLKPVVSLNPERVSRIRMKMVLGGDLTDDELQRLQEAAEGCKVHNTLHAGAATELHVTKASDGSDA